MKVSILVSAAAVVLSASAAVLPATRDIDVMVHVDKTTLERDLEVRDAKTGLTLGYSCSTTLDSGSFANLPISTQLGEDGYGYLLVGSTKYLVDENPESSGGISCGTMYNDVEMFMTCLVPIPSSLELAPLATSDTPSCFSRPDALGMKEAAEPVMMETEYSEVANITAREENHLVARQGACGLWTPVTRRVHSGYPHQYHKHEQLTDNLKCRRSPSCDTSHSSSKSFSFGWSADVSPAEWISGGFSVTRSWETTNDYACYGKKHETICVWENTAYTRYLVINGAVNTGCGGYYTNGKPFHMKSPNKNNVGGFKYCGRGKTCKHANASYWVKGRAGKP